MKVIKGNDIIEKIKEFNVKGCDSWVDLIKYIMLQLKGKRLIDEAELRECLEKDNGNLFNYGTYSLGEINGRTQLLKELLKE